MDRILPLVLGLLCLGLPVLLIVGLVLAARATRRRRLERQAMLASWAAHREWEYRPSDPALVTRFDGPPFGTGDRPTASNVVLGRHAGRPFTAFDYSYTTTSHTTDADGHSHSSTSTHRYAVVALHLGLTAPPLAVGPSSTMKRFWNKLTRSDIDVGDPAFDREFLVRSTSPEFARDVLSPDVIALQWQNPAFSWRFAGDSMLVVRAGEQDPGEVEAKLAFMHALLERVPQRVWDRLRGETPR